MAGSEAARGQIVTFYSYKGGTGRTMALANVAWILASQGLQVLVVDWDLESPGLHRYFHPFLRDKELRATPGVIEMIWDYSIATLQRTRDEDSQELLAGHAKIQRRAVSLHWDFPHGGVIDFVAAGQQDAAYSRLVSTFDWANFYERQGGAAFIDAVRAQMRAEYDVVLVDSRTGLSDVAGICTVQLPDVVVNCFTMSTQSIRGAAAVARSIRAQRPDDPPLVVPVPMRVEDAELRKLETGRDLVRAEFAPFLDHLSEAASTRYWNTIEVPYRTFYAYEEILAAFGDRPEQAGTLLAAYEQLTSVITGGRVTRLEPMAEEDRRRSLVEFERSRLSAEQTVLVAYAAVDRLWAEWIGDQLEEAGLRVDRRAVDVPLGTGGRAEFDRAVTAASRVLVVLTRHFALTPLAADTWKLAASRDQITGGGVLVPLRVDESRLTVPYSDRLAVDVTDVDPSTARARLLEAAGAPAAAGGGRAVGRFPGPFPTVWNVRQHGTPFVGRAAQLEALRDRLTASPDAGMQVVHGLGGVGKTQLAAEYALRFARDYDLVWWIPADNEERIRGSLADLAEAMGLGAGGAGEAVRRVLDVLRRSGPDRRWLIVLDNADEPTRATQALIPQGPGHVLLTTRDQSWAEYATATELTVFDRAESVQLLRDRVRGLTDAEAAQVAEKLGDLPLAVEQGAAYLRATALPVERYLASLDTPGLLRILEGRQSAGYSKALAATWLVTLGQLRREKPAAARLLELCSFYAPEPIPVTMLTGERFAAFMTPFDPTLTDPILQGLVTAELGRYGLAQVDAENNTVRIHRLVQLVIQDQLDDPEDTRRQAQLLLAAASPRDPDKPANWARYAELWPHVRPSGLHRSTADEARQLVVDTVRYLYRRGDYETSRSLAEDALAHWRDTDEDDPTTLRMRFHLANVLRAQTHFDLAYAIDQDVYERQRRIFGEEHLYTVMTARSLGADLRAQGRFHEAEERDRRTLELSIRTFGEDSGRTLTAENNLAVSLRLVGDFRGAAQLDQHIHERRRDRFGEEDPSTLASASNYGRGLRDTGELWRSHTVLHRTYAAQQKVVGPDHPETLRTAKELALTLRQLGRFPDAHRLLERTVVRYQRTLGGEHPDTLSAEMALATTWSAVGDNDTAVRMARRLRDGYREVLGETHAITLACLNNLGVLLRKQRDHVPARELAEQVRDQLLATLGERHPHTLLATLNLANDLSALGERDAALLLDTTAYVELTRVLGAEHPDTLAASVNLALSRMASESEADAGRALYDEAFGALVQLFGGDNPRVVQARQRERANAYIEPALL
ncbi:FxSxx-COOH system tetratricopeptide repeat protein [Micromonospora costi]|uniref:TIR domain-containing protein n=1 Tax=Micromonospora costi TaxID=1530042 RepID=A0A3A9ZZZ8_9ACTN|nr:FxSxx-COOH system tetratricopeptide repeat protein [Micromonospora costi]RKN52667.1 TIR domain-containing protein [Micromonospora costi]